MDLVASFGTKVVVTMEHTDKKGNPKILSSCSLPLTGKNCIDMIITDMAVFDVVDKKGLRLVEISDGVTVDDVKAATGCEFEVSKDLCKMRAAS